MPNCFRGGAPPRTWADFLRIFFIGAIYSLKRYIASSPQGVCRPKIRDAPEGNHKTDDPVALETEVDSRNRPEDQLLARQHT